MIMKFPHILFILRALSFLRNARGFVTSQKLGKEEAKDKSTNPLGTSLGKGKLSQNYVSSSMSREDVDDLAFQLENIRCPAKAGLDLRDYWRCLWKSSVSSSNEATELGDMFDESDRWEARGRLSSSLGKKANRRPKRLHRIKRSIDNYSQILYYRVYNSTRDLYESMADYKKVRRCQVLYIYPGADFRKYFYCLRDSSERKAAKFIAAMDDNLTVWYNTREFDNRNELCLEHNRTEESLDTYCVKMEFILDPLEEEDKVQNFAGADPYLLEQYSLFRYKYNNLVGPQRQPAWSFNGLDAANQWHEMKLNKFYLPLKESVSNKILEEIELKPDFAQTYPGLGEVIQGINSGVPNSLDIGKVDNPLDYTWTKDRGYHAYTRYLIPLLDDEDIAYYKYKEALPPQVKKPNEIDVIRDIVTKLQKFENKIVAGLVTPGQIQDFIFWKRNASFSSESSIPFVNVYRDFFQHYYSVDVGVYRNQKLVEYRTQSSSNPLREDEIQLHNEYEMIRKVLESYLQAVIQQMKCLVVILEDSLVRKDEKTTIEFLKTVENSSHCNVLPRKLAMGLNETINTQKNLKESYFVPNTTLKFIYDSYFTRKESRKRYTLPLVPERFPICRHNEPSPIDIITKSKDRKSSLKSYELGPAAYKLNRFFIMFPSDGSHLLTVGIVDGERLDGSSVLLKGGAVKGQNLTFQYMFIRFGKDWQSEGSEHRIDGKPGQMELQLLFTISGSADTIKYWHILARIQNQMFQSREKLVIILSVLVDVVETDEKLKEKIKEEKSNQDPWLFEPFTHAAYNFRYHAKVRPNDEHPRGYVSRDPVFRLIEFLPHGTEKDDNAKFYTYRGSLSWPPCFGYVLWSVFHKRLYISKRQFDEFIKIPAFGTSDHNRVSDNFRRPKDIYVEEEKMNNDYATVQKMILRRTVDKYILEGKYFPKTNAEARSTEGVVEEEIYYLTEDDESNATFKEVFIELLIGAVLIYFLVLFHHCDSF